MAGRTILLNLVGNDRISRVMRNVSRSMAEASDETSRLSKAMDGLNRVGTAGGLVTSAAGAAALAKAAAPAAAAVAALPAAMAAAKVASGTLKVGLVGVGDAMSAVAEGDAEALDESLKKLAPSARAFVREAASMRTEVMGLQQAVQQRLFRGLASDLDRLGKSLLPTTRKGMVGVAGALNSLGREAVKTASTPWFRGQVAQVMSGTTGTINILKGAVDPLIRSVTMLTVAGFPLLQRMTGWAVHGIEAAAAWLKVKVESGALKATLTGVGDVLARLGVIGGNIVGTIANVTGQTRAMGDAGGSVLTTLEQLTARMQAWTASAEGQRTAAAIFQTLGTAAQQVATVLPLLLAPLGTLLKAVAGLPEPVRNVVGQMLGWAIVISMLANRLKVLTALTLAHAAATRTATAAMTAYRAVAGAAALGGLIAGLRNVNAAFAANATFTTRLGAAIRAQIVLWRAQAAAAGVSTARIIANAAAQKVAAAATKIWAAATWLLNGAMAVLTSPITLVVLAVAALSAAIYLLWKRNETFRSIVLAVWSAVKNAVITAWNFIKPAFMAIANVLRNVIGTALRWYWAYTKFVWGTVWTIIKTVWGFLQPIFSAIVGVVQGVLSRAWTFLLNIIKIVWIAIQVQIKVAWGVIKGIFTAIKWVISNVLAPIFRWLWRNVIVNVWKGIQTTIKIAWAVIKAIFGTIRLTISNVLAPIFRWLWNSVIKPVWNGIKTTISTVWNSGIKPVFNALKSAVGKVRDAFRTAVNGIKTIWDKLKGIAKTPVNFVIGIYNKGIVGLVNKLADFAGVDTRLSKIPLLERGGTLDNPMRAQPMMTNGPLAIVGEGRQAYPEFVIPTDPRYRSRAQALWSLAGQKVMGERPDTRWLRGTNSLGGEGIGFARGGSLQTLAVGGIIGDFVDGVKNFTIGNVTKGAETLLGKVLGGAVPGTGTFRDVVAAIPGWIKKSVLEWVKKKVASFGGGPGMERALAWAKTQSGKPYQWGGNGNPSWDCSGFMSAIESVIRGQRPHRRWSTHPFHGGASSPLPGWHRNQRSGFMIGVTGAGVGHTAGTLLGHRVESSGSGGVQVDGGARGFNDGMFPHRYGLKFDNGGLLPKGWSRVYNGTGSPEPVMTRTQFDAVARGGDGPLVTIGEVVVKERADVDLLADRLGAVVRAAAF
ncbi:hypothetical protein GCM10010182_67680 [Actinomadura cremea]|nr:hypothetical protein GCM10010182_67680 [Actinomadura cremea]